MKSLKLFDQFDFSRVEITGPSGVVFEEKQIRELIFSLRPRIIFSGTQGVGKTHLAKACLNKYSWYMRDSLKEPRWTISNHIQEITAQEFYDLLFDMQPHREERFDASGDFRLLTGTGLLLLDDLGTEKQTDAGLFNDGLKRLLDEMRGRLIVTTNLNLKDLANRYGQKIFSRLFEEALFLRVKGSDYRTKHL